MTAPLADLLEVAVAAAHAGGERTLAHFNAGTAVDLKADGSPVTAADREAEAVMRKIIGAAFPTHAILGEEEGETPGAADTRWIIDPLDGTRTFVRGVPLYGTLVGVEVAGEPIVGVIHLPALGETVWLIPGHCDPTVNLHEHYIVVRGGIEAGRVEAVWPIEARGCIR